MLKKYLLLLSVKFSWNQKPVFMNWTAVFIFCILLWKRFMNSKSLQMSLLSLLILLYAYLLTPVLKSSAEVMHCRSHSPVFWLSLWWFYWRQYDEVCIVCTTLLQLSFCQQQGAQEDRFLSAEENSMQNRSI